MDPVDAWKITASAKLKMDPVDAWKIMALPGWFMASPLTTYNWPPLSAPMMVCVPVIKAGPADMSKSLSDIDFQSEGVNQSSVADNPADTFTKLWLKLLMPS